MTRGEAIKELRNFIGQLTEGCQEAIKVLIPELQESEDENIRQGMIRFLNSEKAEGIFTYEARQSWIAWLEKQKEQKPVEFDEYKIIKKHITGDMLSSEVNKRLTECGWYVTDKPVEWSEEDKHRCKDAIYFLETAKKHYADTSEIELTIEWLKSLRSQAKQEQEEQKPEVKFTGWVARDRNGELWVYGAYPEKDSIRQLWVGSNSVILDHESFPNLKWGDEPMEVEITITRKLS